MEPAASRFRVKHSTTDPLRSLLDHINLWKTQHSQPHKGKVSIQVEAPLDHKNLHVRGGSIIPMEDPALTTTQR